MISGVTLRAFTAGKLVYNNVEHSGNPLVVTPTDDTSFFLVSGLDDGGISKGVVEDGTNGTLTLTRTGWYDVEAGISLSAEGVNTFSHLAFFLEGTEVMTGQLERKVGTGTDTGAITLTDLLYLQAGEVLDLRVKSSNANDEMRFQHITFKARI